MSSLDIKAGRESGLVLALTARIPVMAETTWTEVPAEQLRAAQKRKGWPDAKVAAELYVTEKTWWRYRTAGRIPTKMIPAVARVLDLDLYEHFDSPVPRNGAGESETSAAIERLERRVEELADLLERVLRDRHTGH